uniref:Osmotic avoidance abnormal protein 3-like n=1 Tax=Diabrotica virgifera virgifera TaxID=50390 RepID=A0A6P7FC75_DIAVI
QDKRSYKVHFVDLGGSERQKKSGTKGKTLQEGVYINKSLFNLHNVIISLAEGAKVVPYRDSKLTRLLSDSLGGNCHTLLIACVSMADCHADETISTLKYANKATQIKNNPTVRETPGKAKMAQENYFMEYGNKIDPLTDISFKCARLARDTERRQLKVSKKKENSVQKHYPPKDY